MSDPLLTVSELTIEYKTQGVNANKAVDNVSLDVLANGHTLGIVGESGSGKTSLGMSMMNAIEPPGKIASGRIDYQGRDVLRMGEEELRRYRWKEVALIYQSALNSLNPVKTIKGHVTEVFREHERDLPKRDVIEKSMRLLEDVGIEADRAREYPHQFSGGMKQRIVIAMALALSPKLLIADEPTSALDVVTQKQILRLLKQQVEQRGLSLILITHEIAILSGMVENIAVMFRGEIVEQGPIEKVLFEPLHPYTEMLLSSLLTFGSGNKGLGSTVNPEINRFSETGCKYSNLCKYAFARCKTERPIMREVEKGRRVACHKYP